MANRIMIGQIHKPVVDDFSVVNARNDFVSGLLPTDFTIAIYNPGSVESNTSSEIKELGNGHYRLTFTPDSVGQWYCIVTHDVYFPWGKAASYQIFPEDLESIAANIQFIKDIEGGRWKIDTNSNEMIFFKDDNETEIARFKLFDDKGVASSQAVFERRRV